MKLMYKSKAFSPITLLSSNMTATATTISVYDASVFPAAPNYATIGTDETAETILYTAISGNSLSGITRGVEGTARAWAKDMPIARNFTAADYEAMRENIGNSVEKNTNNAGQIQFGDESLTAKYEREKWSGSEAGAAEFKRLAGSAYYEIIFNDPAEFVLNKGDDRYTIEFNGAARFVKKDGDKYYTMEFPDRPFVRDEGLPYKVLVIP